MLPIPILYTTQTVQSQLTARSTPEKFIEFIPLLTHASSSQEEQEDRQQENKKCAFEHDEHYQEFAAKLLQDPFVHNLLWRPPEQTYSLVPYFQEIWKELERWTLIRGLKGKAEFYPYSKATHRSPDIDLPKKHAILMHGKLLHANLVYLKRFERSFIAAQYPQELSIEPANKKMTARELFWASARYYGSIIDLTHGGDKNISPYYPLKEQIKTYGNIHIERQKMTHLSKDMLSVQYLVTEHSWKKATKIEEIIEQTIINRIHFTWRKPRYVSLNPLCQLVSLIESINKQEYPCIHCTKGLGRTGTLITAYFLKEQIQCGKINSQNLCFSLINLICKLRRQRGPNFVSKPTQLRQLLEYGEFILGLGKQKQ